MMLENNWEKCLFHLHWHRKGRNCWLAIRYVFRTHLFYYLVSKGTAAAFSLLWQTWASTFYSKIYSVLIESGAFLPPAPRPFLPSINVHNMQFSGQFWVKIIWSQKGQVWEKGSYISRMLNRNWCLFLLHSKGLSCCRKNFPRAEMG